MTHRRFDRRSAGMRTGAGMCTGAGEVGQLGIGVLTGRGELGVSNALLGGVPGGSGVGGVSCGCCEVSVEGVS